MIGYVTINVTLFLTNYILEVNFMKRILSLFAAFAVMLSLSACQPKDTEQDAQSSAVIEQTNETTEMKTIEPPEGGWTHEQLSEVTYLCGKPFSLPCKLEDLPDDFEIGEGRYRNKNTDLNMYITIDGQDSGYFDSQILLNGESVGLVYYYKNENNNVVFGVEFYPFDGKEKDFVINGINQNSSFEDVKKSLGNFIIKDNDVTAIYDYKISNSKYPEEVVRIISFDENEVLGICYCMLNMKKS